MVEPCGSVQLHLRQWGDAGQTPFLLLHGHPGNAACMQIFAEALQEQFWVLAPDLRGYGSSQVSTPFQMQDHLLDLDRVLEQCRVDQFLVLGWSLGGLIALELALRHPHRVRGIVLVASAARPRGDHPSVTIWDEINTAIASILNWIQPGSPWVIETWGKRSLYRYLIQRHTPEAYRYLASSALPAYFQTSAQAQQALRQALRQRHDRTGAIGSLQMPTLVLAGEQDRHINCGASQETAQILPNSTWISYVHAAHLFPWEIPAQVQQDLQRWVTHQGW